MEIVEEIKPGRQARSYRRERIKALLSLVKGKRGWKPAFLEAYPIFDTAEGASLLATGVLGRTDDPDLLKALEEWIPKVEAEKPEWFVKSVAVV